jgi:cytochrome b561
MADTPASPSLRYLRYGTVAVALHWLLALMIFGSLGVGLYMHDLPLSPTRLRLVNWHKWSGITILLLSALRLLWRLWHPPPPDLPMPPWQRRAAHAAHGALYLLFFAVPLAGWAYSSAVGFPVVLYGVLPLPDFVAPDRALAATLKGLHGLLAYALAAVIGVHAAAALKHHFIDHDGLLLRMLPARRL